jgi:3-methyladenine DNA glycosylase AlkC
MSTMKQTFEVITGGQTGIDRAALDVAMDLGIPCGGWCPAGRKAEDGRISERYPLRETTSRKYSVRTCQNVRDTDGTLILHRGPIAGGTALTVREAQRLHKPLYVVDLDQSDGHLRRVLLWLEEHQVRALNVAGPRESTSPGIYEAAQGWLEELLGTIRRWQPDSSVNHAPHRPAKAPRKGAAKRADIPKQVLADLNAGRIETRTLVESFALDFPQLVRHAFPDREFSDRHKALASVVPITRRMRRVGDWMADQFDREEIVALIEHPSDTVRGWAAYALGSLPKLSFRTRLRLIRPFADDPHFGVREWAWLSIRSHLEADLEGGLVQLVSWSKARSENIRRFAIEITRPRGVWCAHLGTLKESPELALPLLENVHADKSRYVQNSVGNWLNDAAKTRPGWVRKVCVSWRKISPSPETAYICQRALRSLGQG